MSNDVIVKRYFYDPFDYAFTQSPSLKYDVVEIIIVLQKCLAKCHVKSQVMLKIFKSNICIITIASTILSTIIKVNCSTHLVPKENQSWKVVNCN
jgi:hypothetical protein